MPDAVPQPSAPAPPHDASPPPAPTLPPQPETASPRPDGDGALFRALVDAGADAVVAYTADQRIHLMIAANVATQLQPLLAEMRELFATHERRVQEQFDQQERRVQEQFDQQERRFAEQDRKLDVLTARVEGLKVLVHVVLGALALLVTALIAVFGLLFTT